MKTNPKHVILFAAAWVALCTLPGSVVAQRGSRGGDDSAKSKPKITAITGADIHTVTNGVIRGGTILVQDGKILDVGQGIEIPEGAEVIDAKGKVVTPGFIAISMTGVGVPGTPSDNDRLGDALDPFDRNIKYALGVGITTGCVQLASAGRGRGRRREPEMVGDNAPTPEERFLGLEAPKDVLLTQAQRDLGDENTALCPCCGLPILPTEPITPAPPAQATPRKHAVIKMSYGHLDPMLVTETAFYDLPAGALTSALSRHNWRVKINGARQPQSSSNDESARGRGGPPGGFGRGGRGGPQRGGTRGGAGDRSSGDEELQKLVSKEIALRIEANTVDEIRDMIALAQELDYKLVIEGGIEAWVVADELGEAKVPVIFTPRNRREARRGDEDHSGSSIESTGMFEQAGVPFATAALSSSISMNGLAGRDLTSLPLEAAFAVRGGATEDAALRSLTLVPAQMLGLDDRIGSIEKGKDADLLILNGGPLDFRTYVDTAIVAGEVCYQRAGDQVYPVYER